MIPSRVAAAATALLLVALGVLRADGSFFAAALPLALFAGIGAFRRPPVVSLQASRTVSSRFATAGARVEVLVTITCTGPRIESLVLLDPLPPELQVVEGSPRWQGSLDHGGQAIIRYCLEPARGLFHFEGVEAEAEDPFTCLKTNLPLPCPSSIAVYPRAYSAPGVAFGTRAVRPFSGRSRAKRAGSGPEFSGTRDYAPGDPLRHLNWRAEALWGRPIVNVFEEERAIDVGIILDCRAEAYDTQALFEEAAAAALSLAEELLDHGHRIAFLNYGALISWTPPGSGREQRLRVRMAAAQAILGAHAAFDSFDNLPVRLFPPRSLVLLVSPLRREDVAPLRSLRALGYEVAVLRPDMLAKGGPAHRILVLEAEVLQSRLLRSGVTLLDWNPTKSLGSLRIHAGSRA